MEVQEDGASGFVHTPKSARVGSGDDEDGAVSGVPHFSPDEDAPIDEPPSPPCHGAFVGFCTWGRAVESTSTNHHFTAEELVKMNSYSSTLYLEPDSEAHRAVLGATGSKSVVSRSNWDRWLTMAAIGVLTGLVGSFVKNAIEALGHLRLHPWAAPSSLGLPLALLWSIGIGALFAAISSSLVICIQPAAAASGVPEIMAFLNGVLIRKVFNVTTGLVKFVSVIFAVASGLPVGPEGPMIHLGAFIGAGVSQGRSDTLNLATGCCRRFRNSRAQRDFISAGAAAGIASAFGAPIGGLLFAMEEVSSFFTINLCTQIFFCAMCATTTTTFINSYFEGFVPRVLVQGAEHVELGAFYSEASWVLEVTKSLPLNILAFFPAIVLGIIGGALGALFTFCNIKVVRLRKWIIAPRPLFRICEPIILVVIFASLSVLLPLAFHFIFGCTVAWDAETNILSEGLRHEHALPHNLTTAAEEAMAEHNAELREKYLEKRAEIFAEKHLVPFLCTEEEGYNELASLLYNGGESIVKLLMSRGTHRAFGAPALIILILTYAPFACWIAGSAVSSGLVVPMLLIGGAIGRLVGIALAAIVAETELSGAGGYWEWVDPGAFCVLLLLLWLLWLFRFSVFLIFTMLQL